jgi:replicative DNA helicase
MDTNNFFNILNKVTKKEEVKISSDSLLREEEEVALCTLYTALSNNKIVIDFLSYEHFIDCPALGIVYEYCITAQKKNELVTIANLKHDLAESEAEAIINIQRMIASCQGYKHNDSVVTLNCAYSLDERYKTIQIKKNIADLSNFLSSKHHKFSDIKKIMEEFEVLIKKLTFSPFGEKKIFDYLESIEAFESDFFSENSQRISSGLIFLDNIIGGFGRGELVILGGRPGMGKTAFSIHTQATIAEAGHSVLCFNFEMSNNQNASRFISRETYRNNNYYGIPYNKFMKKEGDLESFKEAFDISKNAIKKITNNYAILDVDEIVSYSTQHAYKLLRDGETLDFIVIDYLQIIKMKNKRDAHLEIGEITGKLKQLAKELNCCVLCLSQLNRALESANDKRPSLQHLRQSGKIEEDADIVLFPYRPSYYERDVEDDNREWLENYFEIIVEKNRVGNKGIAKIKSNMSVNYFEDGDFEQKDADAGKTKYGKSNKKSQEKY